MKMWVWLMNLFWSGVAFDYIVRVGQKGTENMFYDINLEVGTTIPGTNVRHGYKTDPTSDNSISHSEQDVNIDSEKSTRGAKFSVSLIEIIKDSLKPEVRGGIVAALWQMYSGNSVGELAKAVVKRYDMAGRIGDLSKAFSDGGRAVTAYMFRNAGNVSENMAAEDMRLMARDISAGMKKLRAKTYYEFERIAVLEMARKAGVSANEFVSGRHEYFKNLGVDLGFSETVEEITARYISELYADDDALLRFIDITDGKEHIRRLFSYARNGVLNDSNRELTKDKNGGIIRTERDKDMLKVNTGGKRNEKTLTKEQIKEAIEYAVSLGMPPDRIYYVDYDCTAYGTSFDMLRLGTDLYPADERQRNANSNVSAKGAIAHEIVGHRNAALKGYTQKDDVLEEAQASIRAAKFAPGLSYSERNTLIRDAL